MVLTRAKADSPNARALRRAGVEVVRIPGRAPRPDLGATIAELGRREILSVLLEAGGTLNSAALAAGIVDKMRVFFAPVVAGSASTPEATERLRVMQYLRDITVKPFGPDFAVEGYFRDVYGTR